MVVARFRGWIQFLALIVIATVVLAGCATGDDDVATDDSDVVTTEDVADELDPTPTVDATQDEADDPEPTPEGTGETETPEPAETADTGNDAFPVTVTGSDGEQLTLEERPERIVSLSPGATETFFAVGAGDQLVAADMFSDYPPEALDLEQVDSYQPDPEAIVDMDPDLVFVIFDAEGVVEFLEDLDIPVLYLEAPASLHDLMEQIRLLGEVTGNGQTADDLASSLEDRIQDVTERIEPVEDSPRVYHELDETFFTVAPESFVGDLYSTLNATNIAEGAAGEYPQLSEEVILEENPDVIIVPVPEESDGEAAEAVRSRPGWDVIDAVQNDRVYEIEGDIVSRPGPRIVDALEQLAEMLYPEEFVSHYDFPIRTDNLQDAA